MFDDFIQEKKEKETDPLSFSPLPLNKKLGLGVVALAVLCFCVWYSCDSSPSSSSPKDTQPTLAALALRIENLENKMQLFSSLKKPYLDEDVSNVSAASVSNKNSVPVSLSSFSDSSYEEEHDPVAATPSQNIVQSAKTESVRSDANIVAPQEIAFEFSSLFEKELTSSPLENKDTTLSYSASAPTSSKEQSKSGQGTLPSTPTDTLCGSRLLTNENMVMYTVQKGDTLSKIAARFYGTAKKWKKISDANKEKLGNDQVLKVGMTLMIPAQ